MDDNPIKRAGRYPVPDNMTILPLRHQLSTWWEPGRKGTETSL